MLIGISGNKCSGKTEVREYLQLIGFNQLAINEKSDKTINVKSISTEIDKIGKSKADGEQPQLVSTSIFSPNSQTTVINPANSSHNGTIFGIPLPSDENRPQNSASSPQNHLVSASTAFTPPITSDFSFRYKIPKPPRKELSDKPLSENSFPYCFENIELLIEFATKNWSDNYVCEVPDLKTLDELSKRPFFLHVAVDSPTTIRWERYRKKHKRGITFPEFVDQSDEYLFGETKGAILLSKAQVVIINKVKTVSELYVNIGKLNLTEQTRLRPSWDAYFMQLADLAAQRSNCMKRRVGCVLIRDKRVIATGYNGTPRGLQNCNEGGCKRCNMAVGAGNGLSTCLCLHAEENAILEAGRDRLGTRGVLYCNTCPCLTCSIKIVQSGIREVVYSQSYSMDTDSAKVLEAGGITLRQYSPPKHGLVM